jgi:hypothetical protein
VKYVDFDRKDSSVGISLGKSLEEPDAMTDNAKVLSNNLKRPCNSYFPLPDSDLNDNRSNDAHSLKCPSSSMRSSSSFCSLCRNVPRPKPKFSNGRRAGSSSTRKNDTFNASKLVLDLDAADSIYVRRFEDYQDDEVKTSPDTASLPPPKISRLKKPHHPSSTSRTLPRPSDIYQATASDFLGYAILGAPKSSGSNVHRELGQVFETTRLRRRKGTFAEDIRWLKDNAEIVNTSRQLSSEERLSEMFACSSISALRRFSSNATSNQDGCLFLATNDASLVKVMQNLLLSGLPRSEVLKYINSTIQVLTAQGVDPGRILVENGMFYAASLCLLQPLKHYIDMVVKRQYSATEYRIKALSALIGSITSMNEGIDRREVGTTYWNHGRVRDWYRRDALRIMTGWETGGIPRDGEKRENCFARIVQMEPSPLAYFEYIQGLATLGASEAIWCEFMYPEHAGLNREDRQLGNIKRAETFADAFLKAEDIRHALQLDVLSYSTTPQTASGRYLEESKSSEIEKTRNPPETEYDGRPKVERVRKALLAHYSSYTEFLASFKKN